MHKKRAALITGAGKRIGKEIAKSLAKSNVDIALHFDKSQKEAAILQDEIEKFGVKCEIFQADLKENCYEKLLNDVVKKFPHLDILINNAAIFEETPFLNTQGHSHWRSY